MNKCILKNILGILAVIYCFTVNAQNSRISLNSDNNIIEWRVKSQAEAGTDVQQLFSAGYDISDWVKGNVPGTCFGTDGGSVLGEDPTFGYTF